MEDEFNDWYDLEHTPDRASIPGFESARRFVCVSGWPKYVSFYDLETAQVLESEAYRVVAWERFSPWTKRVMARVRGQYRASGDQVYPGNAITGEMGRLTLMRFRNAPDEEQPAILKGLLGNYERRQETAQIRLFRSDYDNRIDYVALVESRLPFSEPGMDLSLFGNAGNRIDLFNQYVPYWTRGPLPGVTTRS
jgi:hypothetical protein